MSNLRYLVLVALSLCIVQNGALASRKPRELPVGTASLLFGRCDKWTYEAFAKAKADGVDYIEISANALMLNKLDTSDAQVEARVRQVKRDLGRAGMKVWSVHMAYGQDVDISQTDETLRQKSVALHIKMLKYCKILKPRYLLFHPSWYLTPGERERRKDQFYRSVSELNPTIRRMGCTMVIENLLGPELPWRGKGDNDWTAILCALDKDAHYKGVFMYEIKKASFKELADCYRKMYSDYCRTLE